MSNLGFRVNIMEGNFILAAQPNHVSSQQHHPVPQPQSNQRALGRGMIHNDCAARIPLLRAVQRAQRAVERSNLTEQQLNVRRQIVRERYADDEIM